MNWQNKKRLDFLKSGGASEDDFEIAGAGTRISKRINPANLRAIKEARELSEFRNGNARTGSGLPKGLPAMVRTSLPNYSKTVNLDEVNLTCTPDLQVGSGVRWVCGADIKSNPPACSRAGISQNYTLARDTGGLICSGGVRSIQIFEVRMTRLSAKDTNGSTGDHHQPYIHHIRSGWAGLDEVAQGFKEVVGVIAV